jgi:hypothetical protein
VAERCLINARLCLPSVSLLHLHSASEEHGKADFAQSHVVSVLQMKQLESTYEKKLPLGPHGSARPQQQVKCLLHCCAYA